jgi:predicted methyltransferase
LIILSNMKILFTLLTQIAFILTNNGDNFNNYINWGINNGVILNKIAYKNLTPENRYVVATEFIKEYLI